MGIEIIAAPSSLGLRPVRGHEPGTWRAPGALLGAGMATALEAESVTELPKPPYSTEPQAATRIRNGVTMRAHALALAAAVQAAHAAGRFPVVLGGDCSILLGCLLGARRGGPCGLLHVDGHSDFFHPGNYDTATRLGAAAGMDLALATGRGELLLTHWPGVGGPLAADVGTIQIGDREVETGGHGMLPEGIAQVSVQELLEDGIGSAVERATGVMRRAGLTRSWLHVDLDVLDREVLPAVDSPGSPGLDFDWLASLIAGLVRSTGVVGLDLTIYDPQRDRRGAYAAGIVACVGAGLAPLAQRR
jgi:arginase